MNESSPPLKVWFYTIAVIALLLTLSGVFIKSSYLFEKSSEKVRNMTRKSFTENKKDTTLNTSIAFLGSSLTSHALYNFRDTDKKLRIYPKGKTNILRLTINSLNNQVLEDFQIFNSLIESPPDYLFIEINHLLVDKEKNIGLLALLNSSVIKIHLLAKKTIGIIEEDKFSKFVNGKYKDSFFTETFNIELYSQILQIKRLVRAFSQNKEANGAYTELIKRKTKIIFLDMPRASKLEMVWLDASQKKELQTLLQTYDQTYGIPCWKYPYRMKDADFADGGHLNYKGAKKYQNWLSSQFKLLK
jgi:hypothetical protein